jgi:superfamily II DNA or RNA helicase
MNYAIGSLVKARGREWVVLSHTENDVLMLRPLGGTEDEVNGIYLPLEPVLSAHFDPPDPTQLGDYRSSRLLRDAVRLGFRSSTGPFRSFARIAVEPRPYQLVPLLLALNLDPVRILISDDVGIGKTIESCLIARELLDRREVERFAVLCPPHLAEQWHSELREKFHINAELVLPSTIRKLSQHCRIGQSIFELYPYVIVSTDFIKSDSKRTEFLRACPELVIVDEAHGCAYGGEQRSVRHQRYQLVSGLAADKKRHMIFVTATPHSGNERAFRSLLKMLNPAFKDLPEDLSGEENVQQRRHLAQHFIQRRRGDIKHYLDADTIFPERNDEEATYNLSSEYKHLFDKVLKYARETVSDPVEGHKQRQRVRWWSALALLRSLASSPAAAAATLRARAANADAESIEEADEIGRRSVFDLMDEEALSSADTTPGSDPDEQTEDAKKLRKRLLEMCREAETLKGEKDQKLKKLLPLVKSLVNSGSKPIIFCRFIPTAEYVAEALRTAMPNQVEVVAVTGILPPAEREERILELSKSEKRVLVATDCLSEGINLQEHFDAVIHYDLSWNPTRHEQREGRVDRYGQPSPKVRVITYYGTDNQIDGIVLKVLLRKHKMIRNTLGISVPVPVNTDQVVEAVFEGVLLSKGSDANPQQGALPGFEEIIKPHQDELSKIWDTAAQREKRSRTMFAQETIKVEDVKRELKAAQEAIGLGVDVKNFVKEALQACGAVVSGIEEMKVDLKETSQSLREAIGFSESVKEFTAKFELPVQDKQFYLNRTHPVVEGLASYVVETALDAQANDAVARRCGVIRTKQVESRTTALLVRFRFHLITQRDDKEMPLLAEECRILAFTGSPKNAKWLSEEEAEKLLQLKPGANINPDQARQFISKVIDDLEHLHLHLDHTAKELGDRLLETHRRVRKSSRVRGISYRVEPQLPPDLLGIYVYLPTDA